MDFVKFKAATIPGNSSNSYKYYTGFFDGKVFINNELLFANLESLEEWRLLSEDQKDMLCRNFTQISC